MKAVRYHGKEDIRVEEVAAPSTPGPKQIVIKPKVCGICGTDLHDRPHRHADSQAPTIELIDDALIQPLTLARSVRMQPAAAGSTLDPCVPCVPCIVIGAAPVIAANALVFAAAAWTLARSRRSAPLAGR